MGNPVTANFYPYNSFDVYRQGWAFAAGPAEAKSGSKQAPAKAHGKAQTRTAIPVAQPVTSSKERVDAEAVFRGADAAFGGVPPRAVPVSSNSTAAAGAQLLPQQSRAPLAPAPEVCCFSISICTVAV